MVSQESVDGDEEDGDEKWWRDERKRLGQEVEIELKRM